MVRHLIKLKPELFVGFPGCDSPEMVQKNHERITNYAYHASLCHDIVLAADCMDAATDSVGRSYNKGETFEMLKRNT